MKAVKSKEKQSTALEKYEIFALGSDAIFGGSSYVALFVKAWFLQEGFLKIDANLYYFSSL